MTTSDQYKAGRVPFGYRARGGAIEPDPVEAGVVRLAFELFAQHRRKKTAARLLNEAGHRTRREAPFSDTAVGRLLRAPYGSSPDGEVPGSHPPLVDSELWRTCKAILDDRQSGQPVPSRRPAHPFSATLECACGGRMRVPTRSARYVCVKCRNKIPTGDLEDLFRDQLEAPLAEAWTTMETDEKVIVVENVARRIVVGDGSVTFELRDLPFPSEIVATGQRNAPERNDPDTPHPTGSVFDRIRLVFQSEGADRMFSADLAEALGQMSQRELAAALRPLGIRPQNIRVGKTVKKGYLADWFRPSNPSAEDTQPPPPEAAAAFDSDDLPDPPGASHGE